jgi:glycosyltransferase involved in cell wall biosynthesis
MGRTRVISLGDGKRATDLVETLNNFRPDLLHAIHPLQLGVQALGVAEEMGIPTITSYHSEFLDLARQWGFEMTGDLMWSYLRILHDLADKTLVPSFINKMQLRDLGFDRVETWGHGVDTDLFSPRRRSEAWRRHLTDGEPNKTLLVYAGRLGSDKHVELLLPIIKANPDCRLAIVGDGPELRWLRDFFEGTPTLFTGKLDQGDLAEVYASADLFVHPASNRISPVTTLEAMASGLPVLAPHSGAIVDFAVHGENALLYLPGETEQAANYVKELSEKPGLRTDLSRIARQTALGRSWHLVLDRLLGQYAKVAEARSESMPLTYELSSDLMVSSF